MVSPPNAVLLETRGLSVRYGAVQALLAADIQVRPGEIVSILGANGAGKSTTLQALSGLVPASEGSIHFDGEDITALAPHHIVRRGMVQCPEGRRIFPQCSVQENLEMGAYVLGDRRQIQANLEKALDYFPRLAERRTQMGSTLSGGEQQMLGVARAMMSNPRLLLLDEPSLGLAPLIVEKIFEIIRQINADGVTILLVEQNAREALQVSHRGYVLETGRIRFSGAGADLLQDPRVVDAYLGV